MTRDCVYFHRERQVIFIIHEYIMNPGLKNISWAILFFMVLTPYSAIIILHYP